MSDFITKLNKDKLLKFQIKNSNDVEEIFHILSGVLSQSVIETVIEESTDLMKNNINLRLKNN